MDCDLACDNVSVRDLEFALELPRARKATVSSVMQDQAAM